MSPNPSPAVIEAYEARLIIADVLEALSEVDDAWGEHVATHYEGCHVWHVQCFAAHLRSLIEDGAGQ